MATNTLDADLSHLAAPESVTAAAVSGGGGFPGGGQQPPIVVTELAPGIYHFGGREASGGFQYNLVLVEFEDHTELIEPSSHALTLQAIEKAREVVPDKPLTKMIMTHSHSDHAGGARTAVAEGLALVVHESAVGYFDDIIQRPFASNPDYLAMNPVEPKPTEGVGDHLRVEDAMQTMDIYHFPGNAHADQHAVRALPGAWHGGRRRHVQHGPGAGPTGSGHLAGLDGDGRHRRVQPSLDRRLL